MKCTFHIGQTKTHISHPYSCVQDHIAVQSSEQSRPPLSPQAWLLWSQLGVTQKWDMHHTQQMYVHRRHKTQSQLNVGRTFTVIWNNWIVCNCLTLIGAQSSFRGISNHAAVHPTMSFKLQTQLSQGLGGKSWNHFLRKRKTQIMFKKSSTINGRQSHHKK